jgi:hypothetical protein
MNRLFNFVRSDLFLSLAGGFALGIAGLAVIQPASADIGGSATAKAISVGAPVYEAVTPAK